MNKERYGELNKTVEKIKKEGNKITYDVVYWSKREHSTTYIYLFVYKSGNFHSFLLL